MTWLVPGAFAALVLLAGPAIVHLLARSNARRLVFPATHFVPAMQAAATRFRRPSDVPLLLLRLAIVAAVVLAAARPLVMTPWRLARWNARVSRAVIVDTSRSMTLDRGGSAPDAASRLADQEMRAVFAARRVNTPRLADGIARAARWLATAAPSRREVVLISDFQRGSIWEEALKVIPADAGVRLIRAGLQPDTRAVTGPIVEGWRGGTWQATMTIDATGTRADWVRRGDGVAPAWISVVASPADAAAADRALRAAGALGLPAGDTGRRVLLKFAGAAPLVPPAGPIRTAWIASAALTLRQNDLLRALASSGVAVMERDGVMVVDAAVMAASAAAPALIRATMLALRPAAIVDGEDEVATVPDGDLARWRRDPAPVTRSAIPRGEDSDSRWLWALALALLVVEGQVRRGMARKSGGRVGEVHADAA